MFISVISNINRVVCTPKKFSSNMYFNVLLVTLGVHIREGACGILLLKFIRLVWHVETPPMMLYQHWHNIMGTHDVLPTYRYCDGKQHGFSHLMSVL